MQTNSDTIAAIATPPGRGGIGIVRVSGIGAAEIADAVLGGRPPPRRAVLKAFLDRDGAILDQGIALWMPGPDTLTGEDVLELQGHGGSVVMDLLLRSVLRLGARSAEPGEFLQRAFINDRIDLAQAEAIADIIDSGSEQAARAAVRSLRGELSQRVHELTDSLTGLRVYVEAAIDFPEEEVDFLAEAELQNRLADLRARFDQLDHAAQQGALLREGMTVVIAGAPNAGKSSLLNRLAGYDAAIVTDVPGTTRDVLRERINLDGMPLHIIDTAGLRDAPDAVEAEGVRRARAEIASADRVLLVIDSVTNEQPDTPLPDNIPLTIVRNKIDLAVARNAADNAPGSPLHTAGATSDDVPVIEISALNGTGLDELKLHLQACMGFQATESGLIMARRRHLDALARARAHVETGAGQLMATGAGELLAEELRLAQGALAEITGEVSSDDLLGEIFSSFCIGK